MDIVQALAICHSSPFNGRSGQPGGNELAVPDAAHAPVGQLLKLRTYPAVDNHAVTAPNADTLYTTAWLDVSREPWILGVPDMGDRYYLVPMLDGWTNVFQE